MSSSAAPTSSHRAANMMKLLDGSLLEGGGQVLRNCTAYATLLAQPITISNIRANRRPKPGLRPQHLTGIRLLARMSGGLIKEGDSVGSDRIVYVPGTLQAGHFTADPQTAGSVCLLLQSSLPCTLFAPGPVTLELRGGTNATKAPMVDYAQQVLLPTIRHMGVNADITLKKRGYFPQGGGVVFVETAPCEGPLSSITLTDRGDVTAVHVASSVAGKLPRHIAERMASKCTKLLSRQLPESVTITSEVTMEPASNAFGSGGFVFLRAETTTGRIFGGTGICERGKRAEEVAEAAVDELMAGLSSGGAVDEHLADQLIIFMALASGVSKVLCGPLSLHTQTAIHFAKDMTGAQFELQEGTGPEGQPTVLIQCTGIGFTGKSFAASTE